MEPIAFTFTTAFQSDCYKCAMANFREISRAVVFTTKTNRSQFFSFNNLENDVRDWDSYDSSLTVSVLYRNRTAQFAMIELGVSWLHHCLLCENRKRKNLRHMHAMQSHKTHWTVVSFIYIGLYSVR